MKWYRVPILALNLVCLLGCDPEGNPRVVLGDGGPEQQPDGDAATPACSDPGCACDDNSEPRTCYPPPIHTDAGASLCIQGTMYCVDRRWSECISLSAHRLSSQHSALTEASSKLGVIKQSVVSSPTTCNSCQPSCFQSTDRPELADLTAANSVSISYDTSAGGITLLKKSDQRGPSTVTAICGNHKLEGVEACDDDDVTPTSGDGCSSTCTIEAGWICDTVGAACRKPNCGDGKEEGIEQCDDGNLIPGDGCSATCKTEPTCNVGAACTSICGDGLLLGSEACDDGNLRDGDGCSSLCKVESGFTCSNSSTTLPASFDLNVIYRDVIAVPVSASYTSHPDFEIFSGSGTLGLVGAAGTATLVNKKPVWAGICITNTATTACPSKQQMTTAANFKQWYQDADTANVVTRVVKTMKMTKGALTSSYTNETFGTSLFPLDGAGFVGTGKEKLVSGHNFGFTTEVRHWFQFQGADMTLTFSGDDDVWIYIAGKLVVDLGGLHSKLSRTLVIKADGSAVCYQAATATGTLCNPGGNIALGLVSGNVYEMALFHAERHSTGSNFDLTLGGFVGASTVCDSICGDGIVQYDEFCDDGANNGKSGYCKSDCLGRPLEYASSASYWRTYSAADSCLIPPERPYWGALNWTAKSIPTGTSITLNVQGAETLAGLDTATPVPVKVSSAKLTDAGDLRALLLAAGQQIDPPYLRVTAQLATTDLSKTPVLTSFDVSYTCVNQE